MKELLLNSIVSRARDFTTFSMNTGSDFDPWNLKSADFLVHSLHFGNHFGLLHLQAESKLHVVKRERYSKKTKQRW